MTSKEALGDIRDYHNETVIDNYCTYTENMFEKELDIIEKDLEILDILKNESDSKRIIERDGIVSFHLDMILTSDNYNKIKEWLENGND